MMLSRRQHFHVVIISLIVALLLTLIPLPEWAQWYRPSWVTLVIIYWALVLPQRMSIALAWFIGLLLDVAYGGLLGEHAFVLALITYITKQLYLRLRLFPLLQQSVCVFILIGFQQLMLVWLQALSGRPNPGLFYWLPAITSMLVWPWLSIILNDIKRRFSVQ